jgi:hypothetical protein
MIIGSVFSTNIDPNNIVSKKQSESAGCTIYLADSDSSYLHNRGDGCYTVKLSEDAVRNIWNDIIVKGFSVDKIESNVEPTLDREKLIQNQLLVTQANAKAGDLAQKIEVPDMIMNPLETSALLAQSCEGSFQYGLNLDTTLRVGRCEDSETGCYTRSFGLFRQNGLTGFFSEMFSVGKDALNTLGINKAKKLAGEIISGESSEYDVDLGPFSDASVAELNYYKQLLENSEQEEFNFNRLEITNDKSISNIIETSDFSASMETTGRSENTFIHSYSLFDKMFNQYYSTDMILTSSKVLLGASTNRIMRIKGVKNAYDGFLDVLHIKKGGFLRTFLENPANILLNTKFTLQKSLLASKHQRNIAKSLKKLAENGSSGIIKSGADLDYYVKQHGLEAKVSSLNQALKKGPVDVEKLLQDESFFKGLTTTQKNVLYDVVAQKKFVSDMAAEQAKEVFDNQLFKSASKKINNGLAMGQSKSKILQDMSLDEFNAYNDAMLTYQDLVDSINLQSNRAVNLKSYIETPGFASKKINIVPDGVKPTDVFTDDFLTANPQYTNSGVVEINNYYASSSASKPLNKDLLKFADDGFNVDGTIRQTINVNVGGTQVSRQVIVPNITTKTTQGSVREIARVESFFNNYPDGIINVGGQEYNVAAFNNAKSTLSELIGQGNEATLIVTQNQPITNIVKEGFKQNIDLYLDPVDISPEYLANMNEAILKKYSAGVSGAYTNLQAKGFVDYQSMGFLDYKMNQYVNASKWGFVPKSMEAFGYNLLYWQSQRGFSDIGFLNFLGLDQFSVYRLPESYSSINISHQMSPSIYDDAYIDFFANDGSDQGDLFMKFVNSALFIIPFLANRIISSTSSSFGIMSSAERSIDNILRGKIKRDLVDDIVLFTDTINTGCKSNCIINIGSDHVDQQTKEASLNGLSEDLYTNYTKHPTEKETKTLEQTQEQIKQQRLSEMDETIKLAEQSLVEEGLSSEEIQKIVDEYRTDMTQSIEESYQNIMYDTTKNIDFSEKLNLNFYVPSGFSTNNYILENTTQKNYEEKGQNLVTFSHNTDYLGTMDGKKAEEGINLLSAVQNKETCENKLRDLQLAGLPIGFAMPKDYRSAFALSMMDKVAYWTLPSAGGPLISPMLLVTIPKQVLIMPQLKGCVDEKEGYYIHFFMNSLEYERVENDPTNKVADTVDNGLDTIEDTLENITKNTEFEKTVSAGTTEAKNFVEKNLRDHAIVQSKFNTSGGSDADLNGRLFMFELGPNSRCRANTLTDKGVEILIDEDKNQGLEIDKEKGEMNLIDENGNIKKIIKEEESDFVRLVATNLGIPAKIVPLKLTYIPVSDNNETLLFDMDVYGNLFVRDADFMNCIRDGYLAQTGNEIPAGSNNLTEFLGAVKTANIINPLTQYDVYPQNTKITAQGTPRQVADGTVARLSVFGDRTSKLFPVEEVSNKTINLGKNISIQFEKGQLVYSGEKNSYIMWVEYTSVTNGADIKELDAKLEKIDAENDCDDEEIAFSFNATSNNEDPNSQTYNNVDKLNNALEKVGPFQMFDTPTKTFIFYISDYPECEQRLKIIDKETGEIYDMKVTDVTETPEGMFVETEDGATHKFEFDAEHGVPKVKYNDEEETLLSAQGKNGSFWFDPQTGNWYTENGMMIPYNQAFKDGMNFAVGADGKTAGTPPQNIFNVGTNDAGKGSSGFNIPLSPTTPLGLITYILFFVCCFYIVNTTILNPKKTTKKTKK